MSRKVALARTLSESECLGRSLDLVVALSKDREGIWRPVKCELDELSCEDEAA
jgi:hypothetical protein